MRTLSLFLFFSLGVLLAKSEAQQAMERVDKIDSPKKVLKKFGDRSEGILHEGDRLTFMFRSSATEAGLTTMIGAPFNREGRKGPYLGQVVIPNSDRLVMSYAFTENDENGWHKLRHFRGPNAPEIPVSVTPIEGQHIKYEIQSKHLEEPRGLEVYVPPNADGDPLPVVYLTDGAALKQYVGAIDWKIRNGELQPMLVVGVANGGYVGDRKKLQSIEFDHRAQEYLSATGFERYEKHSRFLIEEVLPFIEERHNASAKRSQRVLSGYSNGGACVLTMSVEHPDVFGHVFPYSVAFFDRDYLKTACEGKGESLPKYRFAAGTLEGFMKGTRDSHEILQAAKADVSLRTFVAGHDQLMWKIALLGDLKAIFPAQK